MTSAGHEAQLRIQEGVLLGHALVARLADGLGIRVFFIKGPASVLQGLRKDKISGDVDAFVDPSRIEELLHSLRRRGWQERPVDPDNRTVPKHSITLHHPEWPCCIDVHFRFPGMEKPAVESFDAMWTNTDSMALAGHQLKVPAKELGILFLALHALRSPNFPPCRQELDYLVAVTRRQGQVNVLLEHATATGALAAVRPFLEALLPERHDVSWPEPSVEWRNCVAAQRPGMARLIAIGQAPWHHKPELLCRAAFPRAEFFLSRNIYADVSPWGKVRQHHARWAGIMRMVARLVRELRPLR